MARVLLSSLLVIGLTAAAVAQPEGQGPPSGATLFEEGRALAKEGKYAEACDKFAKSLALDPGVGTQLNFADCHEHLEHYAQAWRLFDDAAAQSEKTGNAERAKFARDRANALLPKLGTIVIKLAAPDSPGLVVAVAGRTVRPEAEIREIVDPGDVSVEVTAPNAPPFARHERVAPGATIAVDVPAPAIEVPATRSVAHRRRSRVHLAWAVAGGGALALLVSTGVAFKAKSDYDEQETNGNCMNGICNADGYAAQNSAITLSNVATVVGVTGVVALTAGAVIWVTAPKDFTVVPSATSESVGVTLSRAF